MAKAQSKPAVTADQAGAVEAISVRSVMESFRRAGLAFGRVARTIPLSELTDAQLQAIEEEPLLVSQRVQLDSELDESDDDAKDDAKTPTQPQGNA